VLTVDGVDVLAQLGIGHPTSCTAGSPCGGNFLVGGNTVTVSDLIVDVGAINQLAANTVSFDVSGLGCGGHLFTVNGVPLPGSRPKLLSAQCRKDPISDTGLSSGFAINITSPTPQETNVSVPVPVQGEVCSGRPIADLNINGIDVPVNGQTHIPGNGTTTADTFKFTINTTLPETSLAQDFTSGDASPGPDPGSNLLIAAATDDEGNRTFVRLFYATGTTLNPGINAALPIQSAEHPLLQALIGRLKKAVVEASPPSTVQVDDAFVIGLSPAAVQQQFDKRCVAAGVQFKTKATQSIQAVSIPSTTVSPPCACDADVNFTIGTITIDETQITCPVTFSQGQFHVSVHLPDVSVQVSADGHCGDCDPFDTATDVTGTTTVTLSGFKVDFDVTEGQLLNPTSPQPTVLVSGTTNTAGNISVDTPCFISQACNFFLDIVTLGLVDFTPSVDFSNVSDFKQAVGASEPDPVKLNDIKIDEQKVANFNQTLSGQLTSVHITSDGILAGLRGTFATDLLDPDIQNTPGALITQPPLPSLPVSGASDAFVALSTDTINMLFASMALAGRLKESCQPSGKTLGDLLPADCDTLTNPGGDTATALQQGVCHGIRQHSCEGLSASTALLTAIKQGACHGTRGDNCSTIAVPAGAVLSTAEKTTCTNTPNLNLNAAQSILLCTRQDIPPRMALLGSGGGSTVSTALRLKALSVALVLDRQGDGLDTELNSTPKCFATGAPRIGDCALFEACLDLNFKFDQQFVDPVTAAATCGGVPGFSATFKEIQILNRQAGVVCSGAGLAGEDSLVVDQSATNDIVTVNLPQKAQQFSPPICMKGLDLGGFVTCGTPQLLTIETDGNTAFKDFLGLTCAISAAP
jgi:hypothetical protein